MEIYATDVFVADFTLSCDSQEKIYMRLYIQTYYRDTTSFKGDLCVRKACGIWTLSSTNAKKMESKLKMYRTLLTYSWHRKFMYMKKKNGIHRKHFLHNFWKPYNLFLNIFKKIFLIFFVTGDEIFYEDEDGNIKIFNVTARKSRVVMYAPNRVSNILF